MDTKLALGVDIGAETIKVIVLEQCDGQVRIRARQRQEHGKDPYGTLIGVLENLGWTGGVPLAATGRLSRGIRCLRLPSKAALIRGMEFAHPGHRPGTVVSIGSQGFSVLEIKADGRTAYRENTRCSQGTGNFLCQLVARFGLGIEAASLKCARVETPIPLSGRCPVILKTDMTHLANKGEDTAAILAGLYDAVCENVQVLIKPGLSPRKVILTGGVVEAPRVVQNFAAFLNDQDMVLSTTPKESIHYLEALGAALVAFEQESTVPDAAFLMGNRDSLGFERLPALHQSLSRVRRIPPLPPAPLKSPCDLVLGFDIGSTGAKVLALDSRARYPVWQFYLETRGDPVGASQKLMASFLDQFLENHRVIAIGVTGSGREIVGSLMASCFGPDPIVIMNEIAAHARGACHYDPKVDTIFEIGGQDAKYTRLEEGNIVDAAMNEACSAGTGSFIAEQGTRFEGISHVEEMSRMAMDAEYGVSLGQHCSVFMAEVIADAVADNVPRPAILAGLYDSIAQNYLNRVKGNRSVGQRIFCQGMPFKSDALAAAIARQTGRDVVVPPNPGIVGALGIALIAAGTDGAVAKDMNLHHFLCARVLKKTTMICKSTKGCGGTGNRCRIDSIRTQVRDKEKSFMWGGNCSLYDKGTRKIKLPDLAPDPFAERAGLIKALCDRFAQPRNGPVIALVEEFALKSLVPFFAAFFNHLGFCVRVFSDQGLSTLKQGIRAANVPFCAPMQIYQGIVSNIAKNKSPDFLFAPRIRELPRHGQELHAVTCPIVQASPDIIDQVPGHPRLLNRRMDMGPGNFSSPRFKSCLRALARDLGKEKMWETAWQAGCRDQSDFNRECLKIGQRALAFSREKNLVQVIVLGRTYTIHNKVLNSNVPNLLREQGAMAIPLDCYPLDQGTPVFEDIYWGSAQACLRAAHQIRRTPGEYAVYCSNYSCGPDSFTLHFFAHIMENKPFTIIETDGHAGEGGTKTRIEAFLYCVNGDKDSPKAPNARINDFCVKEEHPPTIVDAKNNAELLLIPRMGPCAETIAALLCADGGRAVAVPRATRESLRLARQYTSGKECLPMAVTLGALLTRLHQDKKQEEKFAYLMPKANGPCRFGMYNILQRIILEKTEWADRVRLISPSDEDYFHQVPPDFKLRAFACFTATDMLQAALHDVRPVEKEPGLAKAIYDRYVQELKSLMGATGSRPMAFALKSVFSGIFGLKNLLKRAGQDFARAKKFSARPPKVTVVGEIYVRLDTFANGQLVEKLENRGLSCVLAPFSEWLMYTTLNELQRFDEDRQVPGDSKTGAHINHFIQNQMADRLYRPLAAALGWAPRTRVDRIVNSARPYINPELVSETVLSLGTPAYEAGHHRIHGVVAVGPHECMPNKIVESQFFHLEKDTGLCTLAVAVNGEPCDPEVLDRFAFEVHSHHA